MRELKFITDEGFMVYLPIDCRNTLIWGNSATGKTYIYEDLKRKANNRQLPFKCICFDRTNCTSLLSVCSQEQDSIIFIDNLDTIVFLYPEIREYLNTVRNRVVMIGRTCRGIRINRDYCFELVRKGKHIGVKRTFGGNEFYGNWEA